MVAAVMVVMRQRRRGEQRGAGALNQAAVAASTGGLAGGEVLSEAVIVAGAPVAPRAGGELEVLRVERREEPQHHVGRHVGLRRQRYLAVHGADAVGPLRDLGLAPAAPERPPVERRRDDRVEAAGVDLRVWLVCERRLFRCSACVLCWQERVTLPSPSARPITSTGAVALPGALKTVGGAPALSTTPRSTTLVFMTDLVAPPLGVESGEAKAGSL